MLVGRILLKPLVSPFYAVADTDQRPHDTGEFIYVSTCSLWIIFSVIHCSISF